MKEYRSNSVFLVHIDKMIREKYYRAYRVKTQFTNLWHCGCSFYLYFLILISYICLQIEKMKYINDDAVWASTKIIVISVR